LQERKKIDTNYWLNEHLFLGHKLEHELFEFTFGVRVAYANTPKLMEAAQFIAGADAVFCNQNVLHAIAEGMKKPLIQEVYRPYPATIFNRPNADYV
jgi:ADP-heptose:LPS heptosyltransferase